jgi:hypothetical protein
VQRSFADAHNSPAGPKKAQFEERLANRDTRLATPTALAIGRFSVPSTDARTAEACRIEREGWHGFRRGLATNLERIGIRESITRYDPQTRERSSHKETLH